MRITRSDAQQLVVIDCPWIIPALAFPLASIMLSFATLAFTRAMSKPDFPWFGTGSGGLWGSLFSGLMSLAFALAFTFHEEYVFDLAARELHWRRRTLSSTTAGLVSFGQIDYAFTQRNHDGDGDTFRVVLKTDGGLLPLTSINTSNQGRFDQIRDQINAALNVTFGDRQRMESHILEVGEAGRTHEAIKYVQKRYGFEPPEANAPVERQKK